MTRGYDLSAEHYVVTTGDWPTDREPGDLPRAEVSEVLSEIFDQPEPAPEAGAELLRRAAHVAATDPDPRWAPVARLLTHWAWLAEKFPDQMHRRDADPVMEIARMLVGEEGTTDE